jgi:hypothetical protein
MFRPINYVKTAYRNSPWVVISIAAHALVFAILGAIVISEHLEKKDSTVTEITVSAKPVTQLDDVVQPPEPIDLKAVPKNDDAEVVSYEEEMYIPTSEVQEEDLHLNRGDPTGIDNLPPGATGGTSIGVGIAGGHYGTGTPSNFAGRRVGRGNAKGRASQGSTQGTEKAVLEGLRWLMRHQNADGSWGGEEFVSHCTPGRPCIPPEHAMTSHFNEGLTGMALLCFLGAGFTHDSKQNMVDTAMGKRYFLGEVIKKGLIYLRDKQREDGSFATTRGLLYNDVLACMAMTEAYGLTGSRAWKQPAQRGVEFLIKAQKPHPDGKGLWGWRYRSRQEIDDDLAAGRLTETGHFEEMLGPQSADISVTGWVVMALKSAEMSGIPVPHDVYDGAMAFTKWVSRPDGQVGYIDPEGAGQKIVGRGDHYTYHTGTMSALGMLVRTFSEKNLEDPFLEAAATQIRKDLPEVSKDKLSVDYYYWYYGSLALNQYDGPDSPRKTNKFWGPWNEAMKDALLELQDANSERDVCSRGGWLVDDRWSHAGGAIYNTAINTLTLEVYYRYENAFGAAKRGAITGPSANNADVGGQSGK